MYSRVQYGWVICPASENSHKFVGKTANIRTVMAHFYFSNNYRCCGACIRLRIIANVQMSEMVPRIGGYASNMDRSLFGIYSIKMDAERWHTSFGAFAIYQAVSRLSSNISNRWYAHIFRTEHIVWPLCRWFSRCTSGRGFLRCVL